MGTQTKQVAAARAIFESLRTLRPDSTLPFIGLALAHIASNKPDVAALFLREEALKQFPRDAELQAFLGLALQCAGKNAEAQTVLKSVVDEHGADAQPHVRMAGKLIAMNTGDGSPTSIFPRWSELAPSANPS